MRWLLDLLRDSPFSTATWVDALDVCLLAWLTYRGLLLIRGTRAMQSLVGLGLLGAMYVLSDRLGLATLRFVLDNLVVYLVIAILILFQEDIRAALARAGGIFSRRSTVADANLVEDVIRATFELARKKIGALVAFERGVSLDSFTDGAHKIDSAVSTELLQSIFHPSSPLHDGAIVIAHNRLVAAGVFLPINLSRDVSRSFGTRHRAAIGLSEATDAVCLVVSEERGTVTIVDGGEVIPVADADDLRERLQERLGRAARRTSLTDAFRVDTPSSQQSSNNG